MNSQLGNGLPARRMAALLAVAFLYFLSVAFLMQFPRYVLALGAGAQHAGWLLAIGLIPALLLAAPVSHWNQRHGGRWPMLAGGLLAASGNAAMLVIAEVGPAMYLVRFIYAVGHMLVFVSLFAQAAMMCADAASRVKAIGWLSIAIQIGNAVGSAIGEAMFRLGSDWFWGSAAAFSLLASSLGVLWLDARAGETDARPQDEPAAANAPWPAEIWLMVAVGLAFSVVTQFLPAFVDHVVAAGKAAPFAASWYLTTALLAIAAVRLVGGQYGKLGLQPWILNACHLALIACLLVLPSMDSKFQALGLGLLFGLSYGWLYPALSTLAYEHAAPDARGRVSGWLVAAFECGFRLGPIGMGMLIAHGGFAAMFIGSALMYAAILLGICLRTVRPIRQPVS